MAYTTYQFLEHLHPDDVEKHKGKIILRKAIKQVTHFKYLGQTMEENGRQCNEIRIRCALAHSTLNQLTNLWRTQHLSFKTKSRLLNSMVYSILLYGCETWRLNKETIRRIVAFETTAYRKILRIQYVEHVTNIEVMKRVKSGEGGNNHEALLQRVIKSQLRWFGHVVRMDTSALPRISLYGLIEGSKKRGRPRQTWLQLLSRASGQTTAEMRRNASDREAWYNYVLNFRLM